MNGVRITESLSGVKLLIVDEISEDIQQEIKDRLVDFCWGAAEARSAPDMLSVKNTLASFFERYDAKSEETQLGIAGELVVHITLPYLIPDLDVVSVLFNKEERSIKKGFDLVFFDDHTRRIWYGEVKTGKLSKSFTDSNAKARDLMHTSIRGLNTMLSEPQISRWQAARIDVSLVIEGSTKGNTVRDLLSDDWGGVSSQGPNKKKQNGVFAAVVINPRSHSEIDAKTVNDIADSSNSLSTFDRYHAIIVQQDELETVVRYLRDLQNAS